MLQNFINTYFEERLQTAASQELCLKCNEEFSAFVEKPGKTREMAWKVTRLN